MTREERPVLSCPYCCPVALLTPSLCPSLVIFLPQTQAAEILQMLDKMVNMKYMIPDGVEVSRECGDQARAYKRLKLNTQLRQKSKYESQWLWLLGW